MILRGCWSDSLKLQLQPKLQLQRQLLRLAVRGSQDQKLRSAMIRRPIDDHKVKASSMQRVLQSPRLPERGRLFARADQ